MPSLYILTDQYSLYFIHFFMYNKASLIIPLSLAGIASINLAM